jgi:hypothetical protein
LGIIKFPFPNGEKMKKRLGIMLLLFFVGIMPVNSWGLSTITHDDLNNMRKNYGHWSGNGPLGDISRDDIGNLTEKQRLIFSESLSSSKNDALG